ncbi:HD domain-containing protein [Tepidibacillus fermentans]|uniref:Metal dependent phosphohydrolase n=1 Tax=Tepidibacillus fermentans TaxID=1281767 RepID=A0A4R3KEK6_9BACI|nr:HD domain-containing protein [Tepidibacillus fermentans]TCS81071.1 metal dependent phosphohydrolase [Tepidibacillus fermentans]
MKTIRDPVHNIIQFDKNEERLLLDLIDTLDFQRLRHIRQLGLTSFTFPGAEHTRFTHSLGVTHVMKRLLDKLTSLKGDNIQPFIHELKEHRLLALTAALLHDIGHGPFSHVLEKTTKIRHEKWTIAIILGDTEIHQVLENYRQGFAQDVADVIQRTHSSRALVKLLSSQLDADRIDYLLRDSKMTGAGYGYFDLEWLIHVLRIGEVNGEIEVGLDKDKGLSIAEDFVMARYYMYVNVYYHKTSRSAELLIDRIFERAIELNKEGKLELPNDLYEILINGLNPKTIKNYLGLTDNTIWFYIYQWKDHQDPILSDLCSRFVHRKLYKTVPIDQMNEMALFEKVLALSKEKGIPHQYIYLKDEAIISSYEDDYILRNESSSNKKVATEQIILFDKKGNYEELSNISDTIRQIRNKKIFIPRIFMPEEYIKMILKK